VIILKRKIAHKHKTARLTSRSWPSPFHTAHSSPETKIRSAQTSECSPVTTCPCNLNRWWPGLAIVVRSYRSNKNREPAAPQNPKPPFQFIPFISHLQQERERERERESRSGGDPTKSEMVALSWIRSSARMLSQGGVCHRRADPWSPP
jgi:hypothetical protein